MKTTPLLFCLLLLISCTGEGAETPELAATRFIEALQAGDAEDVYACIVRSEAENFQKRDERVGSDRWEDCDIDDFEVRGKELDGNRAKVTVLITREIDGEDVQSEELVVCVEEHRRWKVTMSASSKVFIPTSRKPD